MKKQNLTCKALSINNYLKYKWIKFSIQNHRILEWVKNKIQIIHNWAGQKVHFFQYDGSSNA